MRIARIITRDSKVMTVVARKTGSRGRARIESIQFFNPKQDRIFAENLAADLAANNCPCVVVEVDDRLYLETRND